MKLRDYLFALSSGCRIDGRDVDKIGSGDSEVGIPVTFRVDVADGATANIDTVISSESNIRVTDAWFVKTAGAGGASDTITVSNSGNVITNAMDINIADKVIVRASTIDDAYHEIAAGGTLRVVRTKSSGANVAGVAYVRGIKVA